MGASQDTTQQEVRFLRGEVRRLESTMGWMLAALDVLMGRAAFTPAQVAEACGVGVDEVRAMARRLRIRIYNTEPGAGRGRRALIKAADARRIIDEALAPEAVEQARRRLAELTVEMRGEGILAEGVDSEVAAERGGHVPATRGATADSRRRRAGIAPTANTAPAAAPHAGKG